MRTPNQRNLREWNMQAKDYTVDDVFREGQLLEIPLYQRRYIWDLESQWQPLWTDIERIAYRVLANPQEHQRPYFLGSVVIQQRPNEPGAVQRRTVIDGQQRLTTLQLLLDATHAVLMECGIKEEAEQLDSLIRNKIKSARPSFEKFKVWPMNVDQAAFEEVMSAEPPVDHKSLVHAESRFVRAHQFFTEQVRSYITAAGDDLQEQRAEALVIAMRESLKLVVISLEQSEDPQEIFETLNARGVRLTSADLIKNFLFQRLLMEGEDDSAAYNTYWHTFESPFWERLISKGRYVEPRLAIFLGQFLVSRVAEEIKVEKVFDRFKRYVEEETALSTLEILKQIHGVAETYKKIIEGSEKPEGALSVVERFVYRIHAMDTETVKPVLLHLLDPSLPEVPKSEIEKALNAIESWLVRRAVIRATSKNFNKMFPQIVGELIDNDRFTAGTYVESFLRKQTADSMYWPDDSTVRQHLTTSSIYFALTRSRLRMILEGIEDEVRNPAGEHAATPQQWCERGLLQVEHVMPTSWKANWPLGAGETEDERKERINRIGNLTLLTPTKNAAVSNGPWFGEDPKKHKRALLSANTTFLMNRALVDETTSQGWTIEQIDKRCEIMTDLFLRTWTAPAGHVVNPQTDSRAKNETKASVAKLISSGIIEVGTILELRRGVHTGKTAQVMEDGSLRLEDGSVHKSPSGAAKHIVKKNSNGWSDWGVTGTDLRLGHLWNDFVDRFSGEAEDDVEESDDDEDAD
jgi:hypothetical protein